jgi:heme exporter protein CcmD
MAHFLYMGGYAAFVWPSYGLTLLVVAYNIGSSRRLLARSQQDARRRLAMLGAGE